jgi:hypothetical protein
MKRLREIGAWIGIGLLLLLLVAVLILALPFLLLTGLVNAARRRRLRGAAPGRWGGKRILLVYSDSPHWKSYIESTWLPRYGAALVTLNWSERRRWRAEHPFEAAVFRQWAGTREFNPIIIAFPPTGDVVVIRLWQAFRAYRHGRAEPLAAAERQLEALVAGAGAVNP